MVTPTRPAVAQALPSPGDVIAGKYQLVRVLGEGGMGIVFEAMHLKLRQRVAVKMLLPEMLAHEVIVTRFEREARAAGQLRNRHAARVVDVDATPEGLPYMVMEFLEGHDLEVELTRRGGLPHAEVVDYVLQACSAMIEAHQLGIVHRDLKPANLFLETEGEGRIVKVLDFGISKVQSEADSKLTSAESVMGTAIYMSPEQVRSTREVDARTDIWSLGIILYELIAGQPPWSGTPTQLAAMIVSEDAPDVRTLRDVPVGLAEIIKKALKRDPRERFANVKELALALASYAPSSGVGRMLVDTWLATSSQRLSLGPAQEHARTLVQVGGAPSAPSQPSALSQPSAPSQPSTSNPRPVPAETAPGWTQPSEYGARKKIPIGLLAGLVGGALVLGGLGFGIAWTRRATPVREATERTAAGAVPTAASVAPVAPPATTSAALAPSAAPSAAAASPSPAPAPALVESAPVAARPRPGVRPSPAPAAPNGRAPSTPAAAPPAPAPPAPAPPKPAAKPEQVGNPLLL